MFRFYNQYLSTTKYVDDNGFLHCVANVMCPGVLAYGRQELLDMGVQIPDNISDTVIYLYVDNKELFDANSIGSLSGMPICDGHYWQTPIDDENRIGNLCGNPKIKDQYLQADMLITNNNSVNDIKENLYNMVSAGYICDIDWIPGIYMGKNYHGIQKNIRYNHVALLKNNEQGRCGYNIRILNKEDQQKGKDMTDYTSVRVKPGVIVRVLNEDLDIMNQVVDDMSDKSSADAKQDTSDLTSGGLDDVLQRLEDANQISSLKRERDTLAGKIQELQEQLSAAINPDDIGKMADEMMNEKQDAMTIMNAYGVKVKDELRGLYGKKLKAFVINSIGKKKIDIEKDSEDFINGCYEVYKTGMMKQEKVAGATLINSIQQTMAQAHMRTNKELINKMYGKGA